jgi:tRNA nucleotidyltransferase (CCA-adding enzyme)
MVKFYKVGGCVRDEIIGRNIKDIDFSVEASSYDEMRKEILRIGGTIYLETPKFLTIRANIPGIGTTDYVLCRKDGAYNDGRHPEKVEVGTIHDDLARRDFTMNAIAKYNGTYIDPHGGIEDISNRIIRCVGSPEKRFTEDGLRILRAFRFAITLGFKLDVKICSFLQSSNLRSLLWGVSKERIREELFKMFRADSISSFRTLDGFGMWFLFEDDLWLKPTLEQR